MKHRIILQIDIDWIGAENVPDQVKVEDVLNLQHGAGYSWKVLAPSVEQAGDPAPQQDNRVGALSHEQFVQMMNYGTTTSTLEAVWNTLKQHGLIISKAAAPQQDNRVGVEALRRLGEAEYALMFIDANTGDQEVVATNVAVAINELRALRAALTESSNK